MYPDLVPVDCILTQDRLGRGYLGRREWPGTRDNGASDPVDQRLYAASDPLYEPLPIPDPDTSLCDYTISPDSQWLVYDLRRGEYYPNTPTNSVTVIRIVKLYSVPVGGGTPILLASAPSDSGGIERYSVSDDSTQVFYSTYAKAEGPQVPPGDSHYGMPIGGGAPTKLKAFPEPSTASEALVSAQDGALYYRPAAGGAAVVLHDPAAMGNLTFDAGYPLADSDRFQISADGRRVVYRTHDGDGIANNLYQVRLQGGAPETLLDQPFGPGGAVGTFRISPDSRSVIYTASQKPTFAFELYVAALD